MPFQRAEGWDDDARRVAVSMAAARSAGLRVPMRRRAQLTPFLTKLRSSSAASSIRRRPSRNGASPDILSCPARLASSAKAARFWNSPRLRGPLRDLGPRVRRAIEQLEAERVDHAPIVEVAAPPIHLRRRDALRLVDVRRQQPRLVPAGLPQRKREIVVGPDLLRQRLDLRHPHAVGLRRHDAIAQQALAIALRAERFQRGERSFHIARRGRARLRRRSLRCRSLRCRSLRDALRCALGRAPRRAAPLRRSRAALRCLPHRCCYFSSHADAPPCITDEQCFIKFR